MADISFCAYFKVLSVWGTLQLSSYGSYTGSHVINSLIVKKITIGREPKINNGAERTFSK